MKNLLLTLFCFALCNVAFSQTYTVTGLVKTDANEAMSFATVALLNSKDSTLTKADIADENGGFKLSAVKTGTYFIKIKSVGYKTLDSPVFNVASENLDLPPFVVQTSTKQLNEVVVSGQKPMIEVLADKTVFNVKNAMNAAGTNCFELLRKAPGVIVDNNENLIVEGKAGAMIYIDGKPSVLQGQDLTNYLKTLQASDIDAIEIITQPSSRFDAAGNAGIVNIRLKKDKRFGTNGTFAFGVAQGIYHKLNSSFSVNNRTRKVNFFATYSNQQGKTQSFMDLYRQQANTVFDLKTVTVYDPKTHNVRGGLDYFLNQKSTFGLVLNGNFDNGTSQMSSRTPIRANSESAPSKVLVAQSNTDYDNQNISVNSNYRFQDTSGHSLNIDLDYGAYNSNRLNTQPNFYFNGNETVRLFEQIYQMNTPIDISILTFKSDYEQSLLDGKLGVGFKFSAVKTDNVFDFFDVIKTEKTKNLERSNQFVYNENVNAAYINYNRKWKKINVQGGLRVEQTVSDGNLISASVNNEKQVKRRYTDWFPSGGITYSVNQINSLALNYSRRIERPNYRALNPFEQKIDELSSSKGNPFLRPQYTNNIKLSHTYKYTLTTALSYSHTTDFFAQITDTVQMIRNFISQQNIANQKVLNLGVSYPFQAAKWWSVYMSVNAFYSTFDAKSEKFKPISQATASFYAQNTFTLPRKWSVEVSGWYSSPSVWGGTYVCKSLGSLDLAVQKKLLDDKLSARLSVSDVFFTSFWRGESSFGDLSIKGRGGWESRQIRLNIAYNFGSKQVKSVFKRATGLEDENSRIESK